MRRDNSGRYTTPSTPDEVRFWSNVDRGPTCWNWAAGKTGAGYGAFYPAGNAGQTGAHVWSWEARNGPVPDGLVIDHLCGNRLCVRPDHLDLTGRGQNVLRSAISRAGANMRKTHCIRGHALAGSNLVERPNSRNASLPPYRSCRTCTNNAKRERRRAARTP